MTETELALAVRAAREIGLDTEGARVLRRVASTQIELPAAGAIARVETPQRRAVADRVVLAARFLEERGVRAARLIEAERQPFIYDGGAVTVWARIEIVGAGPSPEELGVLARELHELTADAPPGTFPDLDLFSSVGPWLEVPRDRPADEVGSREPSEDLKRLLEEAKELERGWQAALDGDPLGVGFVHGDLHSDNVVRSPEGLVLLDLEEAGRGPRSWDLVPHRVAVRRYGEPESVWTDVCRGYGFDPSGWDGFETLCRIYELLMVAWAFAYRHTSEAMAAEGKLRVASFLGRTEDTWTLL